MKIERIILRHFIGIKLGLGLDELDIDFTKSNNKITVILGPNGCGKTTLLSSLQPFPYSFDERKTLTFENKDGYKFLKISHAENTYECEIHYMKGTKCFIRKNGVEMNANGNVTTYIDTLYKEFGITKDYFVISKIGSYARSFIDLKPAERKTYIGKFLPDIEVYLKYYSTVDDLYKKHKGMIDNVAYMIDRIPSADILERDIQIIDDDISRLSAIINDKNTSMVLTESEINNINTSVASFKYKTIGEININRMQMELDNMRMTIERDLNKNESDFDNTIVLLKERLVTRTSELDANTWSLNANVENIKRSEELLVETERLLNDVASIDNIEQYENELVRQENILKEQRDELDSFEYIDDIRNNSNVHKTLSDLRWFASNYNSIYGSLSSFVLSDGFNSDYLDSSILRDKTEQLYNSSKTIADKISLLQEKARLFKNSMDKVQILKNRPSGCIDNTCPFIKDAVISSDYIQKHLNVESELSNANKQYAETLSKYEEYRQYMDAMLKIESFFNSHNVRNALYDSIFLKYINAEALTSCKSLIEHAIQFKTFNFSNIESMFSTYIKLNDMYNKNMNDLALKREKYNTYKQNLQYVNMLKSQYEKAKTEIDSLYIQRDELKRKDDDLKNKISQIHKYIELIDKYYIRRDEMKSVMFEYDALTKKDELVRNLSLLKRELSSFGNSLKIKNDEKMNKLADKKNRETYVQQRIELEKTFEDVKLVRKALDMKKGIPVIYTQNYIAKIQTNINTLLQIAFTEKDFNIDFNITDKAFDIIVKSSYDRDVSEISQGEQALVTLSLSLGILKEMMSKRFNLLYLDELDAELDRANSGSFLRIINNQIDLLGVEQLFLISHNEMLDKFNCDFIILDKHAREDFNNIVYRVK